ncbi:sensor histidine kinase [Geodermatophilus marinus]|uniref:sensor histidine kinase n=1 Tax=Geodermatophilus sp. LHW52908 TaxID=2303986 RepID=UPI00131414AB|nr:PAS domain-containing sensor histidine kinase [Geodermatophilus sp. LHW52908]
MRPVLRTAAFAVAFAAAVLLGRTTRLEGTDLALVWPAAGVAFLWLSGTWRRRWLRADLVALFGVAAVLTALTGAPAGLAVALGAAAVVQAVVGVAVWARLAGPARELRTRRQLTGLLGGAFAGAAASALVGPPAVLLDAAGNAPAVVAIWVLRNAGGVVVVATVGLRVLGHRPGDPVGRVPRLPEAVALGAVTAAAVALVFGPGQDRPVTYALLPVAVWAALRLPTEVATGWVLVVTAAVLALTLAGDGPFAVVPPQDGAVLAQGFLLVLAVLVLLLALGRDERDRLVDELRVAGRRAEDQRVVLDAVLDRLPEGVVLVDRTGRTVVRNPAAAEFFPGESESVDPARWLQEVAPRTPDGRLVPLRDLPMVRAVSGEEVGPVDLHTDLGGRERVFAVTARPLPTLEGELGALAVYTDVTEDRMRQAELSSFAGVVAHDLLNPLAALDGWLRVLGGTGGAADPGAAEALVHARAVAGRMRDLVTGLLAYSTARDAALDPVDVPLAHVVDDVLADHLVDRGDEPEPRFDVGDLPVAHVDPVLVRQLLANLVGNAVKFACPGEPARVHVHGGAGPGADRVWVEVRDAGVGIPEGRHEEVFGDFVRARPADGGPPGTGLGLAICRRIARRHGGDVTAAPAPGGGTTVRVVLPAARAGAQPPG